uniref:Uncharacterized protein n=1 Tax=Anguilla anguilla TaxID=7936 RepID=A0A0E9UDW3_ANGAN
MLLGQFYFCFLHTLNYLTLQYLTTLIQKNCALRCLVLY